MYSELLFQLAMSMSADEMFIRSKNIMMQEKLKKFTPYAGNSGGPSGGGKGEGGITTGFSKVLQALGMNRKHKTHGAGIVKVSKADIGDPVPLPEETKKELTRQWMRTSPHFIDIVDLTKQQQQQQKQQQRRPQSMTDASMSSSGGGDLHNNIHINNNNNNNNNNVDFGRKKSGGVAGALSKKRNPPAAVDGGESYVSCSECGYQSVCGTNCCSCSMFATTTAAEEDDDYEDEVEEERPRRASSHEKSKK